MSLFGTLMNMSRALSGGPGSARSDDYGEGKKMGKVPVGHSIARSIAPAFGADVTTSDLNDPQLGPSWNTDISWPRAQGREAGYQAPVGIYGQTRKIKNPLISDTFVRPYFSKQGGHGPVGEVSVGTPLFRGYVNVQPQINEYWNRG